MFNFKPMLAHTCDDAGLAKLKFPLFASRKMDGIRGLNIPMHYVGLHLNGGLVSRSLKSIPNKYVRLCIEAEPDLLYMDGELLVPGAFQAVSSAIMSRFGEPEFEFHVFDHVEHCDAPYLERLARLEDELGLLPSFVRVVEQRKVYSLEELLSLECKWLEEGFEGVMLRWANDPYEFKRSRKLLKRKPFEDAEAIVVGFEELMRNTNEAKLDNLGYQVRSSSKEGLVPGGTLGALVCKCDQFTEEFTLGSGLNDALKREIWDNRPKYLGATVKFKFQRFGSTPERPRQPIFLGFRHPYDM